MTCKILMTVIIWLLQSKMTHQKIPTMDGTVENATRCLASIVQPLKYSQPPSRHNIFVSLSAIRTIDEVIMKLVMENSSTSFIIFNPRGDEHRVFLKHDFWWRSFLFVVHSFGELKRAINLLRDKSYWTPTINIYVVHIGAGRRYRNFIGRSLSEELKRKRDMIEEFFQWTWAEFKVLTTMVQMINLRECKNMEAPVGRFTQLYAFDPFTFVYKDGKMVEGKLLEVDYPDTDEAKRASSKLWRRIQGFLKIPTNLNGHQINISFFQEHYMETFPNSSKLEDYDSHLKEIQLIKMMKDYMNFTPNILQPEDHGLYGSCQENICSGSLKDIVDFRVEMSLNLRFIKQYNTNLIEFSMPVFQDQLCIVVPDVGYISGIRLLTSLYTYEVWVLFLVSTSISMLFHTIVSRLTYKFCRKKQPREKNTCLPPLKALVGVPFKITQTFSLRLQIITCMFVGIIFISVWQGAMFHMARYGQKGKNIQTLTELTESKREIFTSYLDLLDTFDGFERPPLNVLKDRLKLKPNAEQEIGETLKQSHSGILLRKMVYDLDRTLNPGRYMNTDLHMMEECIRTYQLAYIAPKGGPAVKLFKAFTNRIRETGIYEHLSKEYVGKEMLRRAADKPGKLGRPLGTDDEENDESKRRGGEPTSLTLQSLILPFLILQAGHAISIIVFAIEMLMGRCARRATPITAE